jgi:hypothetical protein
MTREGDDTMARKTHDGIRAPRERRAPGLPHLRPRSFKCSDEEWDAINELAAAENTSAATIIRRAIAQYRDTPAVVG